MKVYNFIEDETGLNYFGGDTPENFTIPQNNLNGSLQYIGKISKQDPAFNWLPFDLNILAPIFYDYQYFWMNYSNPLSPKELNLAEILKYGTAFDENLNKDSKIVYSKSNFKTIESNEHGFFNKGYAGQPMWMQEEDIPLCPTTSKPMKFVCQICTGAVKTKFTNIKMLDDYDKYHFNEMNFGDADIYIFISLESKIVCVSIQGT